MPLAGSNVTKTYKNTVPPNGQNLTTSKRDIDRWLRTMLTIIISFTTQRFGLLLKRKKEFNKKERATDNGKLGQEFKTHYKLAQLEEYQPLSELWDILRKKIKT